MHRLEKERVFEQELIDTTKEQKGMCLKLKPMAQRGFPDRTILLPGGKIIFVECKRKKDRKIRRLQQEWVKRLRALGFDAIIADNISQVPFPYT